MFAILPNHTIEKCEILGSKTNIRGVVTHRQIMCRDAVPIFFLCEVPKKRIFSDRNKAEKQLFVLTLKGE